MQEAITDENLRDDRLLQTRRYIGRFKWIAGLMPLLLVIVAFLGFTYGKTQVNLSEKETETRCLVDAPTNTGAPPYMDSLSSSNSIRDNTDFLEITNTPTQFRIGTDPRQVVFTFYNALLNAKVEMNPYSQQSFVWIKEGAKILVNRSYTDNSGRELNSEHRDKGILIKFTSNQDEVKTYFKKIVEIFSFNQYKQDEDNSYLFSEDDMKGETLGFNHQDKEIICKVTANYTDLEISIGCADNIDDPFNQQIGIIKDLKLENQGVYIQNMIGDYAIIHYGNTGSGSSNIVAKINDKWIPIVTSMQDQPSCSVLKEYAVPEELHSECH